MARPHKCTVDYFPHYCVHGKTMYILEQRFGNDGYAFWFKLLERLGKTEGHSIDLNDDIDMEFIAAETRLSVPLTTQILDLLARLEAIDKSLWMESRIIWVQKFVDNLSDAYKGRKVNLPQKPVNISINSVSMSINEVNVSNSMQKSTNEMKLNEMKSNNINTPKKSNSAKPKIIKTPIPDNFTISDEVRLWANKHGHDHLDDHLEAFIDLCKANGYTALDWDSKFKNAIRNDWGKIKLKQGDQSDFERLKTWATERDKKNAKLDIH